MWPIGQWLNKSRIFNSCIEQSFVTNDWKYAIISPYKSKGGHIEALKSTINRKLYSIKRLFFFEFNQDSIL